MIEDLKKRALHRTKIIEGQVRGLQKAIESEDYCVDIITQSLAAQKALGSVNKLVAENHIKTHIATSSTLGVAYAQDGKKKEPAKEVAAASHV